MGRFLLGVLFAFGLWWGYDRFFGSAAEAATDPVVGLGAFVDQSPVGQDQVDQGRNPADGSARPEGAPSPTPPAGGGQGDPPVGPGSSSGFGPVLALDGAERDRAIAGLLRSVRAAGTPAEAVAALGADNAFLHVAEGRTLAVEVAGRIEAELPAWDAVRVSTGLIEAALRGPIGRDRAEARAAFDELAARHARLVRHTVFDPRDTTGARRYEVQSGDHLIGIAKQLRKTLGVKVEAGTLQIVNGVADPRSLRVGQVLKCPVDPIRTVVHKEAFVVAVYVGQILVRSYWCAHGKPNETAGQPTETPVATFTVGEKIENPDWHYGGRVVPFGHPDNPLGTRFVRYEHPSHSGLGIHGTNEPDSIGTMASLGCIRLAEDDIVDYFRLVPRGTLVEVRS
jgi:hypothetical protein